jgi:ABC-2 type transport system permease protein
MMPRSTLPVLLRLELRQAWRERTVPLAAVVLAVAVMASVAAGVTGHRERREAAATLVEAHRSHLASQTKIIDENWARAPNASGEARRGPTHPGLVIVRVTDFRTALPPSPHVALAGARHTLAPESFRMRMFDDEFVPAFPTVKDRSLSGLIPERPLDPPEAVHRGRFTLSFVLVYLLPLLLAPVLYDLIAGDRESGTLALASAQPIPIHRWIAVKIAARAGPIWIAGLLVPIVAIATADGTVGEAVSWSRVAVWAGVTTTYLLFWTAIGVWTSCTARGSAHSAARFAAAYLLVVVALPAVAGLVARTIAPLPPRAAIADREREARFEAQGSVSATQQQLYAAARARFPYTVGDEAAQARSTQAIYETPAVLPRNPIIDTYLDRHGAPSQPAYTFQLRQLLHQARADYIETRMAPLLDEFDRQRHRQRSIVWGAAWVSSALATGLAIDELAGVSDTRRERFLAQLDAYVRGWYDEIYGLLRRNRAVTPDLMRRQAPFTFVEETDAAVIARAATLFMALAVTTTASVAVAGRSVWRLRRTD